MKPFAEAFYNGKAWKATRMAYLQSVSGLCERCLKRGEIEPAKIVHHKEELTEDNITNLAVSLSWDNLEALCQDCHNAEHHTADRPALCYRFDSEGSVLPV